MNFIRLQGLAAGTVSGRNNGRPRCYVEFGVRAKTGFSYMIFSSYVGTVFKNYLCYSFEIAVRSRMYVFEKSVKSEML